MTAHFLSINQTRRGPIRGVGSSYIRAGPRKWTCQRGCETALRPRHSRLPSFISEEVFVSVEKTFKGSWHKKRSCHFPLARNSGTTSAEASASELELASGITGRLPPAPGVPPQRPLTTLSLLIGVELRTPIRPSQKFPPALSPGPN